VCAAIRKRSEQLPSSLSLAYHRLERIQEATKQIEERCQKYATTFQHVSRVFSRLEKFGIEVHKVVNQVEEQERVFEEKRGEVSFLFEELTNLTAWYELFATAYEELLVEIERRHSEHKRIEEMVLAYQKELNLWFEVETQKRDNFYDFYGRYLPQSLCPAIMENIPRYEIYPLHFNTALPVLSQSEDGQLCQQHEAEHREHHAMDRVGNDEVDRTEKRIAKQGQS
jgi:hypothetical protein